MLCEGDILISETGNICAASTGTVPCLPVVGIGKAPVVKKFFVGKCF
jgi:hypothetical protein